MGNMAHRRFLSEVMPTASVVLHFWWFVMYICGRRPLLSPTLMCKDTKSMALSHQYDFFFESFYLKSYIFIPVKHFHLISYAYGGPYISHCTIHRNSVGTARAPQDPKKPERTSPLRRFIILTYQTTNLNLLQSFTPLHIAYEAKTILLLFVDANLDKYPTPSKKTFDFLARKPKNKTEQKKIVFTSRFHLI